MKAKQGKKLKGATGLGTSDRPATKSYVPFSLRNKYHLTDGT